MPVTIDGTLSSLQFIDANGGKHSSWREKSEGGTFTMGALCHGRASLTV